MAKGRRITRSVRSKGALVWTTVLANGINMATGTTATMDIIDDQDWTNVGGSEKATCLRVRGWLSITIDAAAVLTGAEPVFLYVALFDQSAASPNADDPTTYTEEDILWTAGHMFPYSNISQTSPDSYDVNVDIKAMRKIRTGEQLRMVIRNPTGGLAYEFSGLLRALVKRS